MDADELHGALVISAPSILILAEMTDWWQQG
jgi:hypothetical protein